MKLVPIASEPEIASASPIYLSLTIAAGRGDYGIHKPAAGEGMTVLLKCRKVRVI
jgi:hypothetical protein